MKSRNSERLCDLAFVVEIIECLSELNVTLESPDQLLSALLPNVNSSQVNLKLRQVELQVERKGIPAPKEQEI